MMRAQRNVIAKTDRDRFVTAIHWHQINVGIDQQIAFGCAPIEIKRFLVPGLADLDHPFVPLGVVVVIAIGIELVINLRADHAFHFPWRHFAVQRIRDDDVHVIDAMAGQHIEHNLENGLTNIWCGHGRQRQTDVVNCNRHLHPRFQLSEKRITAMGMIQGIANSSFSVG